MFQGLSPSSHNVSVVHINQPQITPLQPNFVNNKLPIFNLNHFLLVARAEFLQPTQIKLELEGKSPFFIFQDNAHRWRHSLHYRVEGNVARRMRGSRGSLFRRLEQSTLSICLGVRCGKRGSRRNAWGGGVKERKPLGEFGRWTNHPRKCIRRLSNCSFPPSEILWVFI